MTRRLLVFAVTFLLAGVPLPAREVALGVIVQTSRAHLNSAVASVGATLFHGDRIATEAKGAASLRAGTAQLLLSENSTVVVKRDETGLISALERGSVAFRTEGGEGFRLSAADISVRPQSSALTLGQVTLENCAVVVTSRVQPLEVTAGKETKIVEGKSYRVLLDRPCGEAMPRPPLPGGYARFWPIPVVAGIATAIAMDEAFESPSKP